MDRPDIYIGPGNGRASGRRFIDPSGKEIEERQRLRVRAWAFIEEDIEGNRLAHKLPRWDFINVNAVKNQILIAPMLGYNTPIVKMMPPESTE
mgnify:CR=1 FL=1